MFELASGSEKKNNINNNKNSQSNTNVIFAWKYLHFEKELRMRRSFSEISQNPLSASCIKREYKEINFKHYPKVNLIKNKTKGLIKNNAPLY